MNGKARAASTTMVVCRALEAIKDERRQSLTVEQNRSYSNDNGYWRRSRKESDMRDGV